MDIIEPHHQISRDVTEDDIPRVLSEAEQMLDLVAELVADRVFANIFALAHSQVEKDDPLRFFVLNPAHPYIKDNWNLAEHGFLVLNPSITRHTKTTVERAEGCVTFSGRTAAIIERWNKCEVEFRPVLSADSVLAAAPIHLSLSSLMAQVFQHEIDHMEAKYVYEHHG
jgi:peptide deformylase